MNQTGVVEIHGRKRTQGTQREDGARMIRSFVLCVLLWLNGPWRSERIRMKAPRGSAIEPARLFPSYRPFQESRRRLPWKARRQRQLHSGRRRNQSESNRFWRFGSGCPVVHHLDSRACPCQNGSTCPAQNFGERVKRRRIFKRLAGRHPRESLLIAAPAAMRLPLRRAFQGIPGS